MQFVAMSKGFSNFFGCQTAFVDYKLCSDTPVQGYGRACYLCADIGDLKWGFAVSVGERRREMASENGALFFVNRLHII